MSSDEDRAKQKYLLHCDVLEKTNHLTIAKLFDEAVKIIGVNLNKELILHLVTDAAPFMKKAAKAIKVFYPKITHVTCIAHGLHRLCERIRNSYDNVNNMIANVKKVFLKAPNRKDIFRKMFPKLALSPEPITIRWGTWLAAVNYYANNYSEILMPNLRTYS